MAKSRVTHLIDEANDLLDNKFHIGKYCLLVNTEEIQDILSKIKAILPDEIKEAERILQRRDDISMEAQNRAERIINEAQVEASRILSEHELMKTVQKKAVDIQQQLKSTCEEMKNKAEEEAELTRRNAYQDAINTREGARAYAEELLANLERDIEKIQQHVKSCQEYISKQKNDTAPQNQQEAFNE